MKIDPSTVNGANLENVLDQGRIVVMRAPLVSQAEIDRAAAGTFRVINRQDEPGVIDELRRRQGLSRQ